MLQVEKKIEIRMTFKVIFFSKPMFVASRIEVNLEIKTKAGFLNWVEFAKSKVPKI